MLNLANMARIERYVEYWMKYFPFYANEVKLKSSLFDSPFKTREISQKSKTSSFLVLNGLSIGTHRHFRKRQGVYVDLWQTKKFQIRL